MAEEDKASRKARRGALTREINSLRRLMAEGDREELSARLPVLKEKFDEFEKAHEKFHSALDEEAAIDKSDEYFAAVENNYIESTLLLNNWIAENTKTKTLKEKTSPPLPYETVHQFGNAPYPQQLGYPQHPGYHLAPQLDYPQLDYSQLDYHQLDYHQLDYHQLDYHQLDCPRKQPAQVEPMVIVDDPLPSSHCMLSCFVFFCCCWPIGIIALYYSWRSSNAAARDDYDIAIARGESAKAASIAGIIFGTIILTTLVILLFYI